MNQTNGEKSFRDKMTEWRGYVLRALEDIDKDLKTLFKLHAELDKRINNLYLKVAGIGAVVGILSSLVFGILRDVIIKAIGGP